MGHTFLIMLGEKISTVEFIDQTLGLHSLTIWILDITTLFQTT